MKTLVILLAIACLFAAVYSAEPAGSKTPETASTPPDQPLYMHLLAPRYYTTPPMPARRIVTARIYLSQEFAVILDGDPNTTLSGRV
jgi:hypothetical protein